MNTIHPPHKPAGIIISVEGGEYTGKTTIVVPGLVSALSAIGYRVQSGREPGGTPRGEEIREEIFNKADTASAYELAELFNQVRKIHLEEVIIPFLESDTEPDTVPVFIIDRYIDSTRVYQGLESGVRMEDLFRLEKQYTFGMLPELTLIMYIPESRYASTLHTRRNIRVSTDETHWDRESVAIHIERQRNYLTLPAIAAAQQEKRQFATINSLEHPIDIIRHALEECAFVLELTPEDIETGMTAVSTSQVAIEWESHWQMQQGQRNSNRVQ